MAAPSVLESASPNPIMFISKEELEERRAASNNLVERMNASHSGGEVNEIPIDTSQFRTNGTQTNRPTYSMEQRALIGVSTIAVGAEKTSEIFGVSESYAKVLSKGAYSGKQDPEAREKANQELKDAIYEGLRSIRDKATAKLMMALEGIDESSIEAISLKDRAKTLANVANQLSSVIDRTINKGEAGIASTHHLHLYAPEVRPLAAFNIKRIGESQSESEANANATSSE